MRQRLLAVLWKEPFAGASSKNTKFQIKIYPTCPVPHLGEQARLATSATTEKAAVGAVCPVASAAPRAAAAARCRSDFLRNIFIDQIWVIIGQVDMGYYCFG